MAPDSASQDPNGIHHPSDQIPDDVTDVVGFIDTIAGNCVQGWAFDRNHPDERLDVEISLDNEPIGIVRADAFSDHLKQGGIDDGAHGFTVELSKPLSEQDYHRISATVRKAGYGGITRLKNQAAADSIALALRPSDFAALAKNLEQCVDDQRAGFRWIYHELQELDQFIRDHARTVQATPTIQAPGATPEATDISAPINTQISELTQNQTLIHESLEQMTALQKNLNKRLEEFEVFNARIDARIDGLQLMQNAEPAIGNDQRRLKRLILFLGCLTAASLAAGIIALVT